MNKISEKAIWDELSASDDEKTPQASFGQPVQPQMMFCYNCNQVIPANSTFCPWCQINLFATCPKCGNRYSSQYPSCNQCGTNLKVYMREQERLREQRLEKQRQEEERKRVEEEQRKIAEEHQRRLSLERAMQEEIRNTQLRARFFNENIAIIKTSEFKKVEVIMNEFEKFYQSSNKTKHSFFFPLAWILLLLSIVSIILFELFVNGYHDNGDFAILFFVFCCIGCFISFVIDSCLPTKTITCEELFKKFLEGYSVDNDVSAIVDSASALMKYRNGKIVLDKKTDFIILSYRRAFHKEFETYLSVFPLRR